MKNEPFDYAHCAALITGASRGIGAAFARELARRGAHALVLVARARDEMEALANALSETYGTRVEVIVADLADPASANAVKAETDRLGLPIDLLVNNAGFGDYGVFADSPLEKQTRMVEVNVAALVALTRLYVAEMEERGRGGIVNIASTASFQPVPYMATYGATKAFVLSFSEALWAENRDRGNDVRVVCLCPGATETAFGAVAIAESGEAGRGQFEGMPPATPEQVVESGLTALDRNASFAVQGTLNYALALTPRLAPRSAVARLGARIFRPANQPVPVAPPRWSRATLQRTALTATAIAAGVTAAVLLVRRERE